MKNIPLKIHELLLKENKTVAVAESCSGGILSYLLTKYPGSSAYFLLGITTYSNQAKSKILNIPQELIAKKGAVSKDVAQKMAGSIKRLSGSDLGIGITGIAGPSGGSAKKPVGTVFIAANSNHRKIVKRFHFRGTRFQIQKLAALKALELLQVILFKI